MVGRRGPNPPGPVGGVGAGNPPGPVGGVGRGPKSPWPGWRGWAWKSPGPVGGVGRGPILRVLSEVLAGAATASGCCANRHFVTGLLFTSLTLVWISVPADPQDAGSIIPSMEDFSYDTRICYPSQAQQFLQHIYPCPDHPLTFSDGRAAAALIGRNPPIAFRV